MKGSNGLSYKNGSSSDDQVPFELDGGWYDIIYTATWSAGSVTLEKLAADGVTWVTAATAFSANGHVVVQLGPGTYRITVATSTAVYVGIDRITYGGVN